MRVFIYIFATLLLASALCAEGAPKVVITVHGDHVEYNQELNTVAVQGQVQITGRTDVPGYPTVSLTADQVEGDLGNGMIVAHGQIKLLSQEFALRGEQVRVNVKTDEFVMENGAASVQQPSALYPGQLVRGYFLGDKLSRQGEVIIVIQGRVTTCDREQPHYSIGARKITYNTTTRKLRIENGDIRLYGRALHIPGKYVTELGGTSDDGLDLPLPGFSSYDGLYWNLSQRPELPGLPWEVYGYVRVGTSLKFPAGLEITNRGDDGVFTAIINRREQAIWDIDRRSRIDRMPDLSYVHHLKPATDSLSQLDVEVLAGHLYERRPGEAVAEASRLGLVLRYSPMPWQRKHHKGFWWASDLRGNAYDTGDSLADWQLEAGTGWRAGEDLSGAIWGVHHEADGESPFLFDDVYSKNEGFTSVKYQLDARHEVELYGHWDFDRGEMRDYSVMLNRRAHCLTWHAQYNLARQSFLVGVDLNGLTGETRPTQTVPLVGADEVPPLPAPVPLPPGSAPSPLSLEGATNQEKPAQ